MKVILFSNIAKYKQNNSYLIKLSSKLFSGTPFFCDSRAFSVVQSNNSAVR